VRGKGGRGATPKNFSRNSIKRRLEKLRSKDAGDVNRRKSAENALHINRGQRRANIQRRRPRVLRKGAKACTTHARWKKNLRVYKPAAAQAHRREKPHFRSLQDGGNLRTSSSSQKRIVAKRKLEYLLEREPAHLQRAEKKGILKNRVQEPRPLLSRGDRHIRQGRGYISEESKRHVCVIEKGRTW